MKNFLILVVMVIIHRSLADVSGDGVIMPTKCEGKFRDIATLMLAIHCMIVPMIGITFTCLAFASFIRP